MIAMLRQESHDKTRFHLFECEDKMPAAHRVAQLLQIATHSDDVLTIVGPVHNVSIDKVIDDVVVVEIPSIKENYAG